MYKLFIASGDLRPVLTGIYIELRLAAMQLKLDSIDFNRVRTWMQDTMINAIVPTRVPGNPDAKQSS